MWRWSYKYNRASLPLLPPTSPIAKQLAQTHKQAALHAGGWLCVRECPRSNPPTPRGCCVVVVVALLRHVRARAHGRADGVPLVRQHQGAREPVPRARRRPVSALPGLTELERRRRHPDPGQPHDPPRAARAHLVLHRDPALLHLPVLRGRVRGDEDQEHRATSGDAIELLATQEPDPRAARALHPPVPRARVGRPALAQHGDRHESAHVLPRGAHLARRAVAQLVQLEQRLVHRLAHDVDFTAAFFLKSTLKNHPSRFLLLGVAGYSLYVVERFLCAFVTDSCCEPMTLADSMWTLIMTVLTIGYGDVVPHTSPGRFFAVLTGAFGTAFTAVMIAVMSNHLVLTRSEHKVNAFLKKDDNRRFINDHAARAIQAFMQLVSTQRRHHHGLNSKRGRAAIRRSEMKLYAVLQAYRQVKRHVNSHDVRDPMDKQMTMLEMMEVNVEYIRTKIEDLSELFHNQADRRQSKRKLSILQLAINSTQQQQELAKNGPSKSNAIRLGYPEGGGLNHSGGSSRHVNALVVASSTSNGQASSHQNGPSIQSAAVAAAGSTTSAPSAPSSASSPERQQQQLPHPAHLLYSRDSSRNLRSESEEMPEWAILLETTLQTILAQVGRVSSEVEAIKLRVNDHIDDVESRVTEIEKKLAVQNAFREITRTASFESGMTSGGMQPMPLQRNHSRRQSIGQRRPSIRNFLTQKDLEEFQSGDSFE